MIRIGIYGHGNLGRGVESAIKHNKDMELVAVFTRRDPKTVSLLSDEVKVEHVSAVDNYVGKIDVMILCGGSATDLPVQTPDLASKFCVIDSFDTHAKIPEHFSRVDEVARSAKNLALISCGWDPGMFSLNRVYAQAVLPDSQSYTFWGKGVSQGHSDAIRRIDGVLDARQYTIPVEEALDAVRSGANPILTTRQKHIRDCYVVAKEGADLNLVEKQIKEMPNYFADYDTTVTFITKEELEKNHSGIPHGGFVITSGKTGMNDQFGNVIEYSLKLDSNPAFTASVLVAYARAVYRLRAEGKIGCITVLDVAPAYLSPLSAEELRKTML